MMNTHYRGAVMVSWIVLCIAFSVCQVMAGDFVPGQVVVRFKNDVSIEKSDQGVRFNLPELDQLNQDYKLEACERIFQSNELKNIFLLDFDSVVDAEMIALQYSALPEVEYACANYIATIGAVYPNDPQFSDQWGLNNTGQTGGTPDADIDAPEAWDLETGQSSVIIAILDTGIDLDHPDLSGKLVAGWDFVNGDSDPQDDSGHGTHVAGIAGASTNNTQGIAGVCWGCALMPVKVLNASGTGTYSQISQGIEYAADHGAKVINLSLGSETESPLLQTAVNYAHTQGCVVVGAAGNFNNSNPFYPAACTNAIAVAGLDHNDVKYQLSGYGEWIDLCAPAVNIRSTVYNDTYASWSGTSMAAPFVSGVAGLLLSANPTWSNNLVEAQMKRMADAVDGANPSHAGLLGQGRVNANSSLITAVSPDITYVSFTISDPSPGDADGVLDPDETVDLTVTLHNAWGDAAGVTGVLSTSDTDVTINDASGTWGTIGSLQDITNSSDVFNVTLSNSCPAGHVVSFNLDLQDSFSNSWNLTFDLTTGSREYIVSSLITTNTTWLANETYLVTSNVLVTSNATLTILPGVTVKFDQAKYIWFNNGGNIYAVGTEVNPILFTSKASSPQSGDWGYIKLEGSGNNATYDIDGNYLSGPCIQYSNIEYGQSSLILQNCSPYIAHNIISYHSGFDALNVGGITCNGSPLIESNIISYTLGAIRVDSSGSNPIIRSNIISNNSRGGDAAGIYITNGANATIESNVIMYNSSHDIEGCAVVVKSSAIINRNLIAHNHLRSNGLNYGGPGIAIIQSGNATITENTIVENTLDAQNQDEYGAGIMFKDYSSVNIQSNNIFNNEILNNPNPNHNSELYNLSPMDIDATTCWWGTTNTIEIDDMIWDFYDDFSLGIVNYQPFAPVFIENAPPVLLDISLNPPSPVGAEEVEFTLSFKGMDTNKQPVVTFGLEEPYSQNEILGNWMDDHHWVGSFNVSNYTGDGEHTIKVCCAYDPEGMVIPVDTHHTFTIETGIGGVQGVAAISVESGIDISWQQNYEPDLLGYMLYYDGDSGMPYDGTGATQGNSPIDVGNVTTFRVTNLTPDQTYYFSVRAYDVNYNLSPYSSEVWAIFQAPSTPGPTVTPGPTATPGLPVPAMEPSGTIILVIAVTMLIFFACKRR